MTTPNAMPTKKAKPANPIHLQLLAGLIKTVPTSWTHKRIDPNSPDPKKPQIIETRRTSQEIPHTTRREARVKNVKQGADGVYRHDIAYVDVPVPTLAGNVSAENVERAAQRWIA